MLKNYLAITWRRLGKDRRFTFLNLLGLSTGLAAVILIYVWVTSETSMDRFHANDDRLYQVMSHIKLPDGIHTQEVSPGLLAHALQQDMPEIEHSIGFVGDIHDRLSVIKPHLSVVREKSAVPNPSSVGNEPIPQPGLSLDNEKLAATAAFVDPEFFQVFSYPLLQGNSANPFADGHSVLLSDQLARKAFHGTQDLIGKTIQWGTDSIPYTITGIFQHPGTNSSAQFDLVFPMSRYLEMKPDLRSWFNSGPKTYLLLHPGTNVDQLSARLKGYLQTKAKDAPLTLSLRRYSDKYLHNTYENGVPTGGRIGYVRLFSLIALFILLLACINFMNLSTAKAAQRAKELGVRKVAGASRRQLIWQYLGESTLMSLLALLFAIGWVILLLPSFNNITGKLLNLSWEAPFWGGVGAITLLTGLVAGSYPALYLSGFRPAAILKGKLPHSPGELVVRKGLVAVQFTLSMLFIVAVLVIHRQLQMVQTANLGYNKEHVISFGNDGGLRKNFKPFLNELLHTPGVLKVGTLGGDLVGNGSGSTEKIDWQGRQPEQKLLFQALDVDNSILDLLDIKIVEGRSFAPEFGSDSTAAILMNETAIRSMGMKDPIGKTFRVWGGQYRIIGVVKDFHFQSLFEPIRPCFMRLQPMGRAFFVRLAAPQEGPAIQAIAKLVKEFQPGIPFEYNFIDKAYENLYTSEQRVAVLSRYFAGLAILISCLGLFGLVAFSTQRRQKEISIRKVIGASAGGIALLLSRDFLKIVLLAILIAFPLSWWMMTSWLNNFAYHITLGPLLFVDAGLAVLFITVVTIGYEAVKAAIVNPTRGLRTE